MIYCGGYQRRRDQHRARLSAGGSRVSTRRAAAGVRRMPKDGVAIAGALTVLSVVINSNFSMPLRDLHSLR